MLLNRLNPSRPAALTRTVTGPSRVRIADSAASTCERSVTSAVKDRSVSEGLRSMVATSRPSARRRCTTARPMPDPPPVTTAVFTSTSLLRTGQFQTQRISLAIMRTLLSGRSASQHPFETALSLRREGHCERVLKTYDAGQRVRLIPESFLNYRDTNVRFAREENEIIV